jgi:predicted ArsR family transcriptional regulator
VANNGDNLDPDLFAARVASLTHTLGDPRRRSLFFFLRENPGATVAEMAVHVGVHANVVRHHLERLIEGGYVETTEPARPAQGRPAKGYRAVAHEIGVEGSIRRDALLVALLQRALATIGPDAAEELAAEVGRDYGRNLASTQPGTDGPATVSEAMRSIAGLLTAHGFEARFESDENSDSLVSDNCPFGTAAQHHPVLCAVDRGLVTGMLEGVGMAPARVTLSSRARGDDDCRVTT